jgi:hypothetical protein
VAAFATSAGKTVAELHVHGLHPAVLVDWWAVGAGDGTLMIAAIPLLLGSLFGGAAVAGGEWRAGTVTTLLTWEPRRLRLHLARLLAGLGLTLVVTLLLQLLWMATTVPAVVVNGSTAGADVAWWWSLVGAVGRMSLLSAAAALIGVSLATLGRNTAFALGVTFAWVALGEGIIRAAKPGLAGHLLGENLAIVLTWAQLDGAEFTRSGAAAAVTVGLYAVGLAAVGAFAFTRRDVAGAS